MLNLSGGGGAYIRFGAAANAWIVSGEEITFNQCLVDPSSLRTGWGQIEAGMAPDWVWDDYPGARSKAPSPEHKRGFSLFLYVKGHGWREWATTSAGSNMGLEALWPAIAEQQGANAGKVAVLAYAGSTAQKVGKGTTRVPNFSVVKWIVDPEGERPSQDAAPIVVAAPPPAAAPAPKAPPAAHVPPPAAKPVMQSSVGDAEF